MTEQHKTAINQLTEALAYLLLALAAAYLLLGERVFGTDPFSQVMSTVIGLALSALFLVRGVSIFVQVARDARAEAQRQ